MKLALHCFTLERPRSHTVCVSVCSASFISRASSLFRIGQLMPKILSIKYASMTVVLRVLCTATTTKKVLYPTLPSNLFRTPR